MSNTTMSATTAATTTAAPAQHDLFAQLRAALQPKGTAPVVRLSLSSSAYFDVAHVQAAVDEAQSRCALVASGLDELSALEKLALHLLCESAGLRPNAAAAAA